MPTVSSIEISNMTKTNYAKKTICRARARTNSEPVNWGKLPMSGRRTRSDDVPCQQPCSGNLLPHFRSSIPDYNIHPSSYVRRLFIIHYHGQRIMADKNVDKKSESTDKVDECPKSSTELISEIAAMDIPPTPRARRGTITSVLLNMGITPVAASALGGSTGNVVSAIFGRRSRANSTIDPPSTGAENRQSASHGQSAHTAQASEGAEPDQQPASRAQPAHASQASEGAEPNQQEQPVRSKPRTLSNHDAGIILAAAGVGGMGPMLSADGDIFKRGQQKKSDQKDNKK
ncbi:Protein of unknown function [Pyronema omphalodes CBS 100304]|nr:Protein of unknown function [Pyronema omphalodes CBS 100304]